ncbi:hypothetical protein VF21_03508 [Pseudogymnoascus sp. 05NY08]|nr:hypothetical protein VF21_03508 [Pseudogymnoascus sp. 05NY08]
MSSQGRSASSGVRNLRAMFENKDDSTTSPPQHRGRSPAPSIGQAGNNSASPRPLSKVRTSFVAVERNGQTGIQWGLRKETTTVPPEDSTMSHRRGSFAENETTDPDVVIERKKSIQAEFKARKNSIDVSETIPEFALEMPSAAASKQGTPTIEPKDPILPAAHTPTGNPDKPSTVEERNAKLLPADVKSAAAVSGGKALKGASGVGEDLKGVTTGKLKTASSAKTSDKASASKSSKPAPISTTKTSTLSKSSKSPALPKTPISATSAKSGTTRTTKSAVEKPTRPSTTTTTTKPTAPSTRTTTNPATKKPALPSSTGFTKPRPKSPTKPAKLPSSLTAPTSSSLSKLTDDARRTSAGSTRSPSRVSAGQKSEQSVSRKAPSSSRPSLGPPPAAAAGGLKKQASRQSLPKVAQADEGFLARMMRPTTASAGKTHDKAATPPKPKVAGERPGTRNGMNARGVNNGSPVAARPPVPTVGAVPTLKPLSAKATAGRGVKKAEKKEVSAPVEAVKAVEPVAVPAVDAVTAPEPAAPVEEQIPEPAAAEEAAVEEEVAAPTTATAEETALAEKEVEIDEPAPAVDIEEVKEVAPVEEVAVEAAAPVEDAAEETTEEATEEAASEVPTEDEPVVTDKVDVEAVLEGTEELVVNDKVDVAAVVEETEVNEAEEAEVEVDEVPVVVETETETAAEETPGVVVEAETETAEVDEAEDVAETTTTTAADETAEEEPADVPTTTTTTTEENTPAKGDNTEKAEVEEIELADASSDVTTPIPSVTPVVAL